MEKEFIPYDLALALKGLGFDEPCLAFYTHQTQLIMMNQEEEKKISIWKNSYVPLGKQYAAPLYQQAFRWFREKYGLRIRNYGSINYSGGLSEYFEIFKYGYGTSNKSLSIEIGALTYEEAELACLNKLIEIVKEKK